MFNIQCISPIKTIINERLKKKCNSLIYNNLEIKNIKLKLLRFLSKLKKIIDIILNYK